jgi:hypothetical protein
MFAVGGSSRQPKTYVKPETAITVFELLMMSVVLLETCWAIKKYWNNKFYYTVASCWLFLYDLRYDARIHEHKFKTKNLRCALLQLVSDLWRKQVCPKFWDDLPKKISCPHIPKAIILNSSTFLLEFLFRKKAYVLKTTWIITHDFKKTELDILKLMRCGQIVLSISSFTSVVLKSLDVAIRTVGFNIPNSRLCPLCVYIYEYHSYVSQNKQRLLPHKAFSD